MKFTYKPSPNYRTSQTTSGIMRDVTLGLCAVTVFSVIYYTMNYGASYGIRVILLMIDSIAAALLTEAVFDKATKKDVKTSILGSYPWITAMIMTLITNVNISYYALFIATVIAIFFGKLVFGGFGQNIFNPAAFGEAIIMNSFAASTSADFVTSATPVTGMNSYGWMMSSSTFQSFISNFGGLGNMFLGNFNSTIGSTCSVLLIIIAIVLIIRKDIDWRLPVFYVGTIFILAALIGAMHGAGIWYALFHILSGGVMFGAVFMITDPVTTPVTIPGRIVFAVGAACLTMILRLKSNLPDGVLYSILLMNMLTPAIDKMMDGCQIKDAKKLKNRTLIVCVCFMAAVLGIGAFVQGKTPAASADTGSSESSIAAAGEPMGLSDDYSDYRAECTESSTSGTEITYACTARGFGLIDPDGVASATGHEYKRNEAEVTVDTSTMSITSMKMTVFGDTEGVGDAATKDEQFAKYSDSTADSSIDSVSGATYTSKSFAAMAQAALQAAGN